MDPLRTHDYLVRSRGLVLDRVRGLTDEQYRSRHPVGLGSIARTLHHVKAAERAYMDRIRGETGPPGPRPPEHDPEVDAARALGFDELVRQWTAQAAETRAGLEAVEDWTTPRTCTTEWEGAPFAYRASSSDFFTQLALHEVHHRAQVLQMLRRLGVDLEAMGEIDFNALVWEPVEVP